MYVHEVPDTPQRAEILESTASAAFHTPDGTVMRCLTPYLFEDSIYSIIFSSYIRIYQPQDADRLRLRILRKETRPSDVWLPTNERQRVLVALYHVGRWQDVKDHFEFKLGLLPFSETTKAVLTSNFFSDVEPNLRQVCQELAEAPGFIATTSTVYRQPQ